MRKPLAIQVPWGQDVLMTRAQIESAIARGVPFTLRMADGREYPVPHRDDISFTPRGSSVIVFDDVEHFTILPLLTVTGLHSRAEEADA